MNYTLRDYQQKGKTQTFEKIKEGKKKIIFMAHTGAGKGLLMADMAKDFNEQGKSVLVVMRRQSLVFQTQANFENYLGTKHSIIMGRWKSLLNKTDSIQISSIDTLSRRYKKDSYQFLQNYDVVIVDEMQDTTALKYRSFLEHLGDKIFIGFSATPFKVGKKGHDFWEDYVKPIEAHELRAKGFLVPCEIFAPPKVRINTAGLRTIGGDYNNKDLGERAAKLTGDIVTHYARHGHLKPAILFAVNIKHSQMLCDQFNRCGIPAMHCDQGDPKETRDRAVQELKDGTIKVICNVGIFCVGIDIPSLEIAILARPTKSKILYIQQVGRVLRPHPGKDKAIILDHAGNVFEHGGVYEVREPELESGPDSEKSGVSTKVCTKCFCVYPSCVKICPSCGHAEKAKEEIIVIEEVEGDLELFDPESEEVKQDKVKKIKRELIRLTALSEKGEWKPTAKYHRLQGVFGDDIWKYKKEIGIPRWVEKYVRKAHTKSTKN